jgi:hypothetical protein
MKWERRHEGRIRIVLNESRTRRWRQDWLEHVDKMLGGRSWGTTQKMEFIETGTDHWPNLWREEGEEEKEGGSLSQYRISLTIKWKIIYRRVYLSCFEFYRNTHFTLWVVIYLWKYRPVTTQHFSPLYWVFNGVPKSNLNTAGIFLTSRVSVIFRKKGEEDTRRSQKIRNLSVIVSYLAVLVIHGCRKCF